MTIIKTDVTSFSFKSERSIFTFDTGSSTGVKELMLREMLNFNNNTTILFSSPGYPG